MGSKLKHTAPGIMEVEYDTTKEGLEAFINLHTPSGSTREEFIYTLIQQTRAGIILSETGINLGEDKTAPEGEYLKSMRNVLQELEGMVSKDIELNAPIICLVHAYWEYFGGHGIYTNKKPIINREWPSFKKDFKPLTQKFTQKYSKKDFRTSLSKAGKHPTQYNKREDNTLIKNLVAATKWLKIKCADALPMANDELTVLSKLFEERYDQPYKK